MSSSDPRGKERFGGVPAPASGCTNFGVGATLGCTPSPTARTRDTVGVAPTAEDDPIPPWARLAENAESEFEDNMRSIIRRIG